MTILIAEITAEALDSLYRLAGLVTAAIAAIAWVYILLNQIRTYHTNKTTQPPLSQKEFNRQVRAYRRRLCRQFRHADRRFDSLDGHVKEVRDAIKNQNKPTGPTHGGACGA